MSKPEDMPIEKAGEVIERFGGIRPMAKKIDVAVTTIQGWKKRDVIPAARYGDIVKAAALHDVDLSDLIAGAPPVNQNQKADAPQAAAEASTQVKIQVKPDLDLEIPAIVVDEPPVPVSDSVVKPTAPLAQKPTAGRRRSPPQISWLTVCLIVIALCAMAALLWPQDRSMMFEEQERLSALEKNVQEIKEKQSFFGTLIPENLDEQIAALKDQAGAAQKTVGVAVETAEAISNDVLAEDAGTFEQRYMKLQDHMAAIAQRPELKAMAARLESWGAQPAGQAQMNTATEALNAVIASVGDAAGTNGSLEAALEAARTQSTVLNETFEGVPQNDLKAAALLLGLSQFRSSLGRDNEAFDEDLKVLSSLIGTENPELTASLEKLAPYAEQGVLTPAGLTNEFKAMAGDAVMASLKGEDVSITERAKARMNDVLQVEKDGQLLSGTETQARMKEAEDLLGAGDLQGAIAKVETLDGPAAAAAAPWLTKAQATLMAQEAKTMIETLVGGTAAMAAETGLPGMSQRIHNEESGINILKHNAMPQVIKMPKNDNSY